MYENPGVRAAAPTESTSIAARLNTNVPAAPVPGFLGTMAGTVKAARALRMAGTAYFGEGMTMLDQQNNEIRLGVAYQYAFGGPGPDITCLVVEAFNEDGTVQCYDVHFKLKIESVKPDRLWRPLRHSWSAWPGDVKAVTEYVGAQALDLS